MDKMENLLTNWHSRSSHKRNCSRPLHQESVSPGWIDSSKLVTFICYVFDTLLKCLAVIHANSLKIPCKKLGSLPIWDITAAVHIQTLNITNLEATLASTYKY